MTTVMTTPPFKRLEWSGFDPKTGDLQFRFMADGGAQFGMTIDRGLAGVLVGSILAVAELSAKSVPAATTVPATHFVKGTSIRLAQDPNGEIHLILGLGAATEMSLSIPESALAALSAELLRFAPSTGARKH
jgi:hypothetical protein